MKRDYWDGMARDFSDRVLEITRCDTNGAIAATAKRLGGARKTATDFGCGTGAATRVIAPYFKSVTGVDFAAGLLAEARKKTTARNIFYERANLASKTRQRFSCDAAFCVNVLLSPDTAIRERIARNVIAGVKKGGHAVFVVPSLESLLRVYQVAFAVQRAYGHSVPNAAKEVDGWAKAEIVSCAQGVARIGGVPTKLYLHDELAEFLKRRGLKGVTLERVSYPWSEVLDDAPKRLKAAPPWDWLAVGVKG